MTGLTDERTSIDGVQPNKYFGDVNRKCAVCGKLIRGDAYDAVDADDVRIELCSEWCENRYCDG